MSLYWCSAAVGVLLAEQEPLCHSQSAIAAWAAAIGTIVLAIVAVFQGPIRRWWFKPELHVEVDNAPPDCHKTTLKVQTRGPLGQSTTVSEAACYYCRLKVHNYGNKPAKQVEVYANRLLRQTAGQDFEVVADFPSMNLKWSYLGNAYMAWIARDTRRHCDIAHIIEPVRRPLFPGEQRAGEGFPADKTLLSFDVLVQPFTGGYLAGPGTYWLVIDVSAGNCKPIRRILQIILAGDWYESQERMLSDGVHINVLDWTPERARQCMFPRR